jgi:hypothetical protein
MEVTFQNKPQDLEAFYDYMVKETEQGRRVSQQVFRSWLTWAILVSLLFGSLLGGLTGRWQFGIVVTLFTFVVGGAARLLVTGFHPIYMSGIRAYKSQEKYLTPTDLQMFQLPRTITIDEKWMEIRNSEALHRWRWRQVDQIGLTANFIFIHVEDCPVVYVPKRDFPSEQTFVEFGKRLVELKEKSKDQPIGAE